MGLLILVLVIIIGEGGVMINEGFIMNWESIFNDASYKQAHSSVKSANL